MYEIEPAGYDGGPGYIPFPKFEDGAAYRGYPAPWGFVAHAARGNHPYPYTMDSQFGIGDGHAENMQKQEAKDFSGWLCNKIAPNATVATYKEGGDIRITIVQNAEHGGHHDFRLCPKNWNSLKTDKDKAECLDMYLLGCDSAKDCGKGEICECGHHCTPAKECGCYSDGCKTSGTNPGLTCSASAKDKELYNGKPVYAHGCPFGDSLVHGANVFDLKLPAGVSCEHCTLQWLWQTTRNGEQFANCADIKIEGSSKPTPPPDTGRRRRRSKPATTPTPPSIRRRRRRSSSRRRTPSRRRSSRRRKTSRRRKSSRRRSSKLQNIVASASQDEYESLGCFPVSENDDFYTIAESADMACVKSEAYQKGPCRSGLPFYRLQLTSGTPESECFGFCASKGLDLFGLHDSECRCGATKTNPVWGESQLPWRDVRAGLILDFSTATGKDTPVASSRQCNELNAFHVFRDIGWLSAGPGQGLKTRSKEDAAYVDAIIKGWAASSPR